MIAVILMIVKTLMLGGWRWQPEPRLFATFSPHFCAQSLCSPVFSLCCLYHFLFVYCSAIECSTVDVAKEPQRILYMLQKGVEYVQETRWRHLFVSFSPLEEELFGSWSFEPVGQSIEGNKDTLITFGFQLLFDWWLKAFSGGFSGFEMLVKNIIILSLVLFWESFTNISFETLYDISKLEDKPSCQWPLNPRYLSSQFM